MSTESASPIPCAARDVADLSALVARCAAGETAAAERLFAGIVDDVHRILYRLVGADPELDDLCQNALVAIFRALPSFRGESAFRTWMYSICARLAAKHRRWRLLRLKRSVPLEEAWSTTDPVDEDPAQALDRRRQLAALERALSRMKPKKREVYVLTELEGLPIEEVATIVAAPVATVHTRLFHARKELRQALARDATRKETRHVE